MGTGEGRSGQPSRRPQEGKGRLDGAAVRRRGKTATGREDRGVGGREVDWQERSVHGTGRKVDGRGR